VLWLLAFASPFVVAQHALIINEIAIVALFALSLDLILGYTGIVSLGHAAFLGFGAYAAALFAKHVMPDPLVGLAVGIVAATALGAVCSFTIMRGTDLTRLMVTLGMALLLLELANKLDWLTGGSDGLQGVTLGPLLGRFEFDLMGQTAAWYSLTVLLVIFLLARRLVHSPFGATLMAVRDNRLRAMAIGIPVSARLAVAYTVAAGVAGAAGALLAQTTGFASLDVFALERSADLMLILVIGGVGWLYGGIAGAVVFKLMHDVISGITPSTGPSGSACSWWCWSWWAASGCCGPGPGSGATRGRRERHRPEDRRPGQAFRRHHGHRPCQPEPHTRCAPCADRPQRRRQDHLDQPDDGRAGSHRRPYHAGRAGHHAVGAASARAPRPGAHLSDQPAFQPMTPLETLAMVVSQHRGAGARWWQALGHDQAVAERCAQLLEQFHLTDVMHQRTEHLAYGKRRLLEIGIALACEPRVLLLDEPVAGVPAGEREELLQTVAALPADVSVLLIEHDMDLVFDFATHHGAGERRGADRGHTGRDRQRSPGQGGVSRARGGGEPCLICCRLRA
jgi:branched-chain amino acid transport system permease protein